MPNGEGPAHSRRFDESDQFDQPAMLIALILAGRKSAWTERPVEMLRVQSRATFATEFRGRLDRGAAERAGWNSSGQLIAAFTAEPGAGFQRPAATGAKRLRSSRRRRRCAV